MRVNGTNRANCGGFTIVEAVVVGALTGIFAIGAFTLFNMYVSAQAETAAMLRLQRQADGLMDEIGRRARGAGFVLGGKESLDALFNGDYGAPAPDGGDSAAASRVNTIIIRDSVNVLAGFRINGGSDGANNNSNDTVGVVQIRGGAAGSDWVDVMFDGAPVQVVIGPVDSVGKASWFGLWRGRKRVSINIVLMTTTRSGRAFTLSVGSGGFRCRN